MHREDKRSLGRRDFLRALGVGAGAAAASATVAVAPVQADSESSADKTKARYRESDDVKAFYRVNRYPAK